MGHDHRKCEDGDDAQRMAETILRCLGFTNVVSGPNASRIVGASVSTYALTNIARNADRIARWAREEIRRR